MNPDLKSLMSIEVPLVVVLGERAQMVNEIRNWIPGSIIELGKEAEEDLQVRVNNKAIGQGAAVKIGENFGIQISYIGRPEDRIHAMGARPSEASAPVEEPPVEDPEAAAAALLKD